MTTVVCCGGVNYVLDETHYDEDLGRGQKLIVASAALINGVPEVTIDGVTVNCLREAHAQWGSTVFKDMKEAIDCTQVVETIMGEQTHLLCPHCQGAGRVNNRVGADE